MFQIEPIGYVKSRFKEPADPDEMRKYTSELIIKSEFAAGLFGLEGNEYIQIIFYFHQAGDYELKAPRRHGNIRGVFASRSPHRPNNLGLTTVKLLEVDDNRLKIKGLDAIDGTPIIDIKPYAEVMDKDQKED